MPFINSKQTKRPVRIYTIDIRVGLMGRAPRVRVNAPLAPQSNEEKLGSSHFLHQQLGTVSSHQNDAGQGHI